MVKIHRLSLFLLSAELESETKVVPCDSAISTTKLSSIDSTFTNWVNQIYLMDYYCATTAVVDQEEEDTKKKCPFLWSSHSSW